MIQHTGEAQITATCSKYSKAQKSLGSLCSSFYKVVNGQKTKPEKEVCTRVLPHLPFSPVLRGTPAPGLQGDQTQDTRLDGQDDQRLPVMMPRGIWWGLAPHRPKANKQARLVERNVCFISDVGNWGWGGVDVCPQADHSPPHP